jgi:hypothetical protein
MNGKELHGKITAAMYTLIKDKGSAAPVDVLMAAGVLSEADYENWRFGRIDYLERVCKINLGKLSAINRAIRVYAQKHKLKPSWRRITENGAKARTFACAFPREATGRLSGYTPRIISVRQ